MSEESLQRLLEQLAHDAAFVERLKADPAAALGDFDLSPAERVALATNDEDGLRRLSGRDAAGYIAINQSDLCPFGHSLGIDASPCGVGIPFSANTRCATVCPVPQQTPQGRPC